MQGKSYHTNPHIQRSDLRYLKVLHWDYDEQSHQGELICNKLIADTMANAAAQDTARKDRVDEIHRQNLERFSDQNIQRESQRAANITNAAQNASNALLSMSGSLASHRANLAGSSKSSTLSPLTSAQRQGMGVPLNEEDARLRAMLKESQV